MYKDNFVIDSHTHVWPQTIAPRAVDFLEGYYDLPWECGGTAADLEKSMTESGVDISVAFSVATSAAQVQNINNFMSMLQNERIVALGAMHPEFAGYKDEIRRIKELGLKGVKFHPDFQGFKIDDISAMRIYEEIGDNLPMVFHLGDEKSDNSAPLRMANVLEQMPYLKVVGAHMGGYKSWDESVRHLIGRDIYLDTCVSIPWLGADFTKMVREHGAEKILFGSDFPAVSQKTELARYDDLDFTEQEIELVLSRNAKKVFGI